MSVAERSGAAPAPESAPGPRHVNPWLILVLVCLGQFMVVLDATCLPRWCGAAMSRT